MKQNANVCFHAVARWIATTHVHTQKQAARQANAETTSTCSLPSGITEGVRCRSPYSSSRTSTLNLCSTSR